MAGPFQWWANRKSRIGISPAALKPPHLPGKEWWTTPPTTVPQPEHIEFVVEFLREVQGRQQSAKRDLLLGRISDWLRVARQLLHEQVQSQRPSLHSTDGLLCEAEQVVIKLIGKCCKGGLLTPEELEHFEEVRQALQARAARIKREHAFESSKTAVVQAMPKLRVGGRLRGGR